MADKLLTHSEIVEMAMRWLRNHSQVVVTELATIGEEPDVLGFDGRTSTLIECKASRCDFLSDKKKFWRRNPEDALGDYRYYCCPRGLIMVSELPDKWGLLEVQGDRVYCTRKAPVFEPRSCKRKRNEIQVLLSVLRRIGQNPTQGVSIRCYTYETKNRATVSIETPAEEVANAVL